jgi:CBS domain-containing protein/anti-sigma regulatory factor (Ser/Thr protein kinase)
MVRKREITKIQELTYEMKVENVMTKDVVTVSPKSEMDELREILRDKNISGAPVVEGNRLVGLVSIEDFIGYLANRNEGLLVEEIMTRNVEILYADEPLVHAVNKFSTHKFGRFPVIERKGKKLVGILTKSDIIKGLLKKLEIDYHTEEIHRYRASHIFEDIIADECMLTFQYNVLGQDFGQAGECASSLKKTLLRLGINPQVVRRVVIATYEAEINIVVFTRGGKIIASVTPKEMRIKAIDFGPGIADIKQALQPGFSTASDKIREMGFGAGMGLNNIQKCSDKFNIVSTVEKGTEIEAIMHIKGRRDN